MHRFLSLSLLSSSLMLSYTSQDGNNAGAELRQLQDEPRENLRSQSQPL
ncbi:hypothetical protein [Pseudomonas sp. RL_5y_Pfl2_70]